MHLFLLLGSRDGLVDSGVGDLLRRGPGGAAFLLEHHGVQRVTLVLQRERVGLGGGELREGVVDVAVVALVGEHALQRVHPLGILGELPVGDGGLGGGQVLPALVQRRAGALGLFDDGSVGVAGCGEKK